jgi:hypothetical protein
MVRGNGEIPIYNAETSERIGQHSMHHKYVSQPTKQWAG